MQPGEVYQLAIVLTALFVAPFSGLGRLVVSAWFAARVLWLLGCPEPVANMLDHGLVLVAGYPLVRSGLGACAWAFSAFIAVFSLMWLCGLIAPDSAWRIVLALAFAQLAFLGLSIERDTASKVLQVWREAAEDNVMRMALFLSGQRHG